MARLSDEDYVVCDECREHLGLVATVMDEDGRIRAERVFLMLPGWRLDGYKIREPSSARDHRLWGHPPKVLPRRFGRPRGKRGPAYVAPLFPDFGHGALVAVCSACDREHRLVAAELGVPGMHDLTLVET